MQCNMSADKHAYVADQVGRLFTHLPHDRAVAASEAHLRRLRDRCVRDGIAAHPDGETVRLGPNVREAVERLTVKQAS